MTTLVWIGTPAHSVQARLEDVYGEMGDPLEVYCAAPDADPSSLPAADLAVIDLRAFEQAGLGFWALREMIDSVITQADTLSMVWVLPDTSSAAQVPPEVLTRVMQQMSSDPADLGGVSLSALAQAALPMWMGRLMLGDGRLNLIAAPEGYEELVNQDEEDAGAYADLLFMLFSPWSRALSGQRLSLDRGLGEMGRMFAGDIPLEEVMRGLLS